jgi:hypothetical protein
MGWELLYAGGGGSVVLGWAKLISLGNRRQSCAVSSAPVSLTRGRGSGGGGWGSSPGISPLARLGT